MAFASMVFVFIILEVIVLAILFIVGIILLVRGFMNKHLAEYAGKKSPKIMMITGGVFVSLPLVLFVCLAVWSITSSVSTIFNRSRYECIPDIWRHESVSDSQAKSDIINALLVSADKGNREAFARNFTPEIQRKSGFDAAVDRFFESYPVGLSKCDKKDESGGGTGSYDYGHKVLNDSLNYYCILDGDWYCVNLEYCYCNTDEPDKVGVTGFWIRNLEASAVFEGEGGKTDEYLVCDIKSSSEVQARLIGGRAYVWRTTGEPRVTAEQLRAALTKIDRLDSPALNLMLGEPNVGIKNDGSSDYAYFYELKPENGEPRYAYFQTDSEFGRILWAFLCTPYEVDYDFELFKEKTDD
ncbi:MAG: DUF5104 domain-containing protein [Clostridia bacterium]|jgi:hypothetical protein|nr:DUF5104 domain-containing protein [Clostridia bacterium]